MDWIALSKGDLALDRRSKTDVKECARALPASSICVSEDVSKHTSQQSTRWQRDAATEATVAASIVSCLEQVFKEKSNETPIRSNGMLYC
jgi:hypothetical protein